MENQAWTELDSDERILELMRVFGSFHDGCVREIHVETGHCVERDLSLTAGWQTTVHMLVQRQWLKPSAIELRFDEVVSLKLEPPPPNCDSVIIDATCRLRDGLLVWADDLAESEGRFGCRIEARRAWWRAASDWMGPNLRYRYAESRR